MAATAAGESNRVEQQWGAVGTAPAPRSGNRKAGGVGEARPLLLAFPAAPPLALGPSLAETLASPALRRPGLKVLFLVLRGPLKRPPQVQPGFLSFGTPASPAQ